MFALPQLILNFFYDDPELPLIPKVGLSPIIKRLFLKFPESDDDELLSTTKIITVLAVPLSKPLKPPLSNVISYPLYTYLFSSLLFTILTAPNKQFLNLKLITRPFGQSFKS